MTSAAVSIVPGQRVPSRGIKIAWENPPPAGHGSNTNDPYAAFADALRGRPGDWAVLKEFPRTHAKRGWSLASRINQGRGISWSSGTFEAAARTVGDQVKVYVRYTGPAVKAPVLVEAMAR